MNNTIKLFLSATPTYSQASNQVLTASRIDECLFFSNDTDISQIDPGTLEINTDIFYIPEGLQNFGAAITASELIVRQDVKRRIATRLPRVTLNQGLFIWSQDNNFSQYFINSVVLKTQYGFIRWGIANFTSDQATNPFADGQQSTLNALWSFFEIPSEALTD
jgi:hypothetical protein